MTLFANTTLGDAFRRIAGLCRKSKKPQIPPAPTRLLTSRFGFQAYYKECVDDSDAPVAALYRIYVTIVFNETIPFRNEIELFFNRHTWSIAEIPNPSDSNVERAAFLAAIPYLLVKSFNRNIGMGLARDAPAFISPEEEAKLKALTPMFETVPAWAENTPPLGRAFKVPATEKLKVGDPTVDEDMAVKNIIVPALPIYFI